MRKIGLLLSILVVSMACGGGGGGASLTGPRGPSRTVIAHGTAQLGDPLTALSQGRLCDVFAFVPFTTSAQGTLDATVDWTLASNDIDLHLERGDCNCALVQTGACQDLASAESTTAKPEKLTVSAFSAGSYTLVVVNAGLGRESASYEVGLTR